MNSATARLTLINKKGLHARASNVSAEGPEACVVIDALTKLVNNAFGEDE